MRKYVLAVLGFLVVGYLCRTQTHGFTRSKIDASTYLNSQPSINSTVPFLHQTFRFLGSGVQTYSFLSEDGKTVLKFIKQSRRKPLPWLSTLWLPPFLDSLREDYLEKRRRNLQNLIQSFHIASTTLAEDTGVFYVHLQKNDAFEGKYVTLIDNLGIAHKISLDQTLFALQEKIEQPRDLSAAQIQLLIDRTFRQCQKKIANLDPLVRNFGFKDGKALCLDIGSFRFQEKQSHKEEFFIELLPLRDIICKEYPHLLDTFDDKVKKILRS
ncbi:MAG: hypothetical protein JSR58_07955 [Verrucomicrobia bacterium]|nr:hypothetical protein [Verrucomicrobiota bacterium]